MMGWITPVGRRVRGVVRSLSPVAGRRCGLTYMLIFVGSSLCVPARLLFESFDAINIGVSGRRTDTTFQTSPWTLFERGAKPSFIDALVCTRLSNSAVE
jgi:hypothetical protein